jgi:transcriptional regulator with XRE-family HTH domain
MAQPPEPPPEARLLRRKRIARKLTPAAAAQLTGFSASTYRQVENGYHVPARGMYAEKIAPPETLAQMLHAFGGTPRELLDAGRADAAEILEGLILEENPARDGAGMSRAARLEAAFAAQAEQGNADPSGAQVLEDPGDIQSWDTLAVAGHPPEDRVRIMLRKWRLEAAAPSRGQASGPS